MGVTWDRGGYYYVKGIPTHLRGVVLGKGGKPIKQFRACLHTTDKRLAESKAAQIEIEKLAEWEAIAAGRDEDARARYLTAKRLAEARGFTYAPAETIAGGDLGDLVSRIMSLIDSKGQDAAPAEAIRAVMGAHDPVLPTLTEMLPEYFTLTKDRHVNKAAHQLKRWEDRRRRAVAQFVEAVGEDPPVDRIGSAMALQFREWLQARVAAGGAIDTQNKAIYALSDIISTWAKFNKVAVADPFQGLALQGRDMSDRQSFSEPEVAAILAGLSGLNAEAADVIRVLVNTGIRPSEILNALPGDLHLDAPIPFLSIRDRRGRELKNLDTHRDIPLTGLSLTAAQRLAGAKDWLPRYHMKGDTFSAAANKYLLERKLRSSKQTVYSLRHRFEDVLTAAGVDDRIRADLMGHKYARPRYGDAGALAGKLAALKLIAL